MCQLYHLLILCIFFLILTPFTGSEIHRAKTHGGKSLPFPAGEIAVTSTSDDGSGSSKSRFARDAAEALADSSERRQSNYTEAFVCSVVASLIVGMSGIFPLLLPIQEGPDLQKGAGAARFKCLLSFAVGSLLGDVFLHLLPEAWAHIRPGDHEGHMKIGLWILFGILTFLTLEKMFSDEESQPTEESKQTVKSDQVVTKSCVNKSAASSSENVSLPNGFVDQSGSSKTNGSISNHLSGTNEVVNGIKQHRNGQHRKKQHQGESEKSRKLKKSDLEKKETQVERIKVTGYLNLLANFIDNFTHGLAVAGSFLVSFKVGVLTTFAIMLHEIPHEIGDFAILLRSGFDRYKAAKAQVYTASGGLCGAMLALMSESAEKAGDSSAWILPFTSGGFLNIALVTVLPDLLEETNPRESIKQVLCLLSGIAVMAAVNLVVE